MSDNNSRGLPIIGLIKEGAEAILDVKDIIVQKKQGGFENYINKRAGELDDCILAFERKDRLSYVAGEVHLMLLDDAHFYMEAEFYFKNKDGGLVKKMLKGKPANVEWEFISDCQAAIREMGKVTFDYERPTS